MTRAQTRATVTLHRDRVIGEVDDRLYGANLEHIGQAVYGGLWAEMLRDRKFAGNDRLYTAPSEGLHNVHPSVGVVVPWEAASGDYEAVVYAHDNSVFYTGRQSQRVTIRRADGAWRGLKQGSLYLQDERAYELRLTLKGEGQPVEIQLGEELLRLPEAAGEWTTLRHTFRRAGANPKGELRIAIDRGSLWIGCASLMPDDHVQGFRADAIKAMRDWGPTQLRWPGGNFVSAYHWRDGVGDRDLRPAYLDPAWWLWESNDVGTDEFIELCRLIDAEPVLTANLGDGTAEEAAAWVEYCNGDSATKYGGLRAEHGYAAPHAVKLWFVGNEQYGNWQVGHVDAETYARRYLEFARAMRAVDGSLELLGVGVPADLYGHWNERVLSLAAAEMDQYSVHYYSVRTEKLPGRPAPETVFLPKLAAWHEVEIMLDRTLEVMDRHTAKPLPMAFDEWNTYVGAKPPDYIEDYNLADALYTGALMNACLKRADRVKYSAIYHLTNVMGCYLIAPLYEWEALFLGRGGGWVPVSTGDEPAEPSVIKMPATLVLELMTRYRGRQAVACEVACGAFSSPAAGSMPAFDAVPLVSAACTVDDDTLYISLVNCAVEQAMRVEIAGLAPDAVLELHLVAGQSPLSTNSFDAPETVTIETRRMTAGELVLPPHSFGMVVAGTA